MTEGRQGHLAPTPPRPFSRGLTPSPEATGRERTFWGTLRFFKCVSTRWTQFTAGERGGQLFPLEEEQCEHDFPQADSWTVGVAWTLAYGSVSC